MLSRSAFLFPMAGAFRRTLYITGSCVAVYVTTATHRRTATQHKLSAAAGARAPGYPSCWQPCNLGMHMRRPCTCHSQRRRPASFDLRMWRVVIYYMGRVPSTRERREIAHYECILVNVAPSYRIRRTTHHARAAALLTAPILNYYPWHQLVWRPPRCVPPLTCCPTQRVPA
jgi:hypothetical protein